MIDHFCYPARHPMSTSGHGFSECPSQLLVKVVTPAYLAQHSGTFPPLMSHSLLDAFGLPPGSGTAGAGSLTLESLMQNARARFRLATSSDQRCNAVMEALKDRLACILDIETDDVDLGRLVSSY